MLLRVVFGLDALITARHLDVLGRLLLCLGCASAYCYAAESFDTLLSGDAQARAVLVRRHDRRPCPGLLDGDPRASSCRRRSCGRPGPARAPLAIAAVGLLVAVGAYADHVMVLVVTLTAGFPAVLEAALHGRSLGHRHLRGLGRPVPDPAAPVPALPAGRLDRREPAPRPRGVAGRAGSGPRGLVPGRRPAGGEPGRAPLWGVSATFASQARPRRRAPGGLGDQPGPRPSRRARPGADAPHPAAARPGGPLDPALRPRRRPARRRRASSRCASTPPPTTTCS